MIKSILILSIMTFSIAMGQNCSTTSMTKDCALECVKMIYEKQYCPPCEQSGAMKENISLSSLLRQTWLPNMLPQNDTNLTITECKECNQTNGTGLTLMYKSPLDFKPFLNCTWNGTDCIDSAKRQQLTDILSKANETWCFGAINEMFFGSNMTTTTSTTPKEIKSGPSSESAQVVPSSTENTVENATKTISENSTSDAVSEIVNDTTTQTTISNDVTTKESNVTTTASEKPKKKFKKAEEHHYTNSVTIIVIMVGVLLSILILSAFILRAVVARRNTSQNRTSSTTYVFEAHN